MPDIPPWLLQQWENVKPNDQRWNLITDFFIDPCEAPVWVYWEAAKPALAEFAMAILLVSPQEVAENYLKPNSPRGCMRRRKRKRTRRRIPFVQGVDEVIADKLPGRKLLAERKASALTHAIFAANELVERPLYWLMLIDLTEDFFYNWASGMIRSGHCFEKFVPMARQWDIIFHFNPYDAWQTVAASSPTKERAGAHISLMQWSVPCKQHKLIFSGQITNPEAYPVTYGFRLIGQENLQALDVGLGSVTVPALETKGFTFTRAASNGGSYNIIGNSGNDRGSITDGTLWDQCRFTT